MHAKAIQSDIVCRSVRDHFVRHHARMLFASSRSSVHRSRRTRGRHRIRSRWLRSASTWVRSRWDRSAGSRGRRAAPLSASARRLPAAPARASSFEALRSRRTRPRRRLSLNVPPARPQRAAVLDSFLRSRSLRFRAHAGTSLGDPSARRRRRAQPP